MSALSSNTLLIKEHVGLFKAANNYDIYDASTGEHVLQCREPNLGLITKIARFTDYKRMTPFEVILSDLQNNVLLKVSRGIALLRSKVAVEDALGSQIGHFQQKLLSIGGKFSILNTQEQEICTLQGKWTGWDFKFVRDGQELAHITKKWNGVGKELFTSADNYILDISETVAPESEERKLIIAAVMCIDMVLKE